MENITTMLSDQATKPKIIIILLFCLRIIFIKSEGDILKKLLDILWPILLSYIINVFNNEFHAGDFNIKLAALKLLEVIWVKDPDTF